MKTQGIIFSLFCTALTLSSHSANAGVKEGGGGNVVVCRNANKKITSVELLDYYESRTLRGFSIDMGPANESLSQAIDVALNRLSRFQPDQAEDLRTKASRFEDNAVFVPGVQLITVPDSNHLFVPDGCRVEQIAIQREPEFPEDKRYTINKDLWDKLSVQNRAGLVLHELLYSTALAHDAQNSVGTRYLNSLIASPKMETMTLKRFVEILPDELNQGVNYNGYLVYVHSWNDNGTPKDCLLIKDMEYNWKHSGTVTVLKLAGRDDFSGRTPISFYPDGTLSSFYFYPYAVYSSQPGSAQHQISYNQGGDDIHLRDKIELYENGNIKFASLYEKDRNSYRLRTPGGILEFSTCDVLVGFKTYFNEDGTYGAGCYLKSNTRLKAGNENWLISHTYPVAFYANGNLEYAQIAEDHSGHKNGEIIHWNEDGSIAQVN